MKAKIRELIDKWDSQLASLTDDLEDSDSAPQSNYLRGKHDCLADMIADMEELYESIL